MTVCSVPYCGNKSGRVKISKRQKHLLENVKTIGFHKVPKDVSTRKKWLQSLNLDDFSQKQPIVCSIHFTDDAFETCNQNRRIKKNAVPTINMVFPEMLEQIQIKKEKACCEDSTEIGCFSENTPKRKRSLLLESTVYQPKIIDCNTNESSSVSNTKTEEFNIDERPTKRSKLIRDAEIDWSPPQLQTPSTSAVTTERVLCEVTGEYILKKIEPSTCELSWDSTTQNTSQDSISTSQQQDEIEKEVALKEFLKNKYGDSYLFKLVNSLNCTKRELSILKRKIKHNGQ